MRAVFWGFILAQLTMFACNTSGRTTRISVGPFLLPILFVAAKSALQSAGGGRVPEEHTSPGAAGEFEGAAPPVFMVAGVGHDPTNLAGLIYDACLTAAPICRVCFRREYQPPQKTPFSYIRDKQFNS